MQSFEIYVFVGGNCPDYLDLTKHTSRILCCSRMTKVAVVFAWQLGLKGLGHKLPKVN